MSDHDIHGIAKRAAERLAEAKGGFLPLVPWDKQSPEQRDIWVAVVREIIGAEGYFW
jgi:hypothetical protein